MLKRKTKVGIGLAVSSLLAFSVLSSSASTTGKFGPPYSLFGGFVHPYGIAVDQLHGRLLVADTVNQSFKSVRISELTGNYVFQEHAFAANADQPAIADPQAIATDSAGNVYLVNTLTGRVNLYRSELSGYSFDPNFCKSNPHIVDGVAISMPRAIAVAPNGAIYLLDSGNKRILKADGPGSLAWSSFISDTSWSNPYGLSVDSANNFYIADTDNHRIIKISGTSRTTLGHWGTGNGEFRYPRDVAIDQQGRLFVADTFNHRIQVLDPQGKYVTSFGHAPSLGTIEKVVVDSSDRVFIVDSDNNKVLAYLGSSVPVPFDPFIRDYLGDTGLEPSDIFFKLSSPDILVRHHPDVDLVTAASAGLETYAFQQPLYGRNNYVYFAVHNRGSHPALDTFVKAYWLDPNNMDTFPQDWKESGFYKTYKDYSHNTPGNIIPFPEIPSNGVMLAGPIVWRPPAPEDAVAKNGQFLLGARLTNIYDSGLMSNAPSFFRNSNNAGQRLTFVMRAPFSEGDQNTLIVRAHFPDLATTTEPAVVDERAKHLGAWIKEVSWNEANVTVVSRGPVTLSQDSSFYSTPSSNLLIEMTQDVLDQLTALEPTLLDGSGPGHEIGRIIVVTNDLTNTKDWATTGAWPYLIDGKVRYLTVSVHGGNSPSFSYAHGMSHQVGMVDLYPHENVTFPRFYANGWDNMAQPFNGAHPLIWSKQLAQWVTSHDSKVLFVPRPPPGSSWNNSGSPIPLFYQETATNKKIVGVAFGLTNGITSITDETAFYYVEARRNTGAAAGFDSVLPQTGVVMYYANSDIPNGQGPVILRDHVPGGTLKDAAIPVGESESPLGTGITVLVQSGNGAADFNLSVQYKPPIDYDLFMHPDVLSSGDFDIWVDNQSDGYDENNGMVPSDRGNQGIGGEENRVYARVYNRGPADAFDVEVNFQFSEPFHTVGGKDNFTEYKSVFIDKIESGKTATCYVVWTPAKGVDPHTCARVELRRLFNDTNAANNWSQRNLAVDHSIHGSPYNPVEFKFQISNKENISRLVYFRLDGVPANWVSSVTPQKVLLEPGFSATGSLKLLAPADAPDCTSHRLSVSGWTPRGDTLVRLGFTSLEVDLQRQAEIITVASVEPCREGDYELALSERINNAFVERHSVQPSLESSCRRIHTEGRLTPLLGPEQVVLRYQNSNRQPIYHTVLTNQGGFQDTTVVGTGGDWSVTAEYPGNMCYAPVKAITEVNVSLPVVDPRESDLPDPEQRLCIKMSSNQVQGQVVLQSSECDKSRMCQTFAREHTIKLKVMRSSLLRGEDPLPIDGEMHIEHLQEIVERSSSVEGIVGGNFRWQSGRGTVIGQVHGITSLAKTRPTKSHPYSVSAMVPAWNLSIVGTVINGPHIGSFVRGSLVIERKHSSIDPKQLKGVLQIALEEECLALDTREQRVRQAIEAASRLAESRCGFLPCLARISKYGQGTLILDQIGTDSCKQNSCGSYKTWQRLIAKLKGNTRIESDTAPLGDGTLTVSKLVQMSPNENGPGENSGKFLFETKDGTRVEGEMLGSVYRRSNRATRLDGRLTGTITKGSGSGAVIETRYEIQINNSKDRRRRTFSMKLDGWRVNPSVTVP